LGLKGLYLIFSCTTWAKLRDKPLLNKSFIFIQQTLSSLRSQNRNVLEFIIETVKANREGRQTPSLIPLSQTQSNSSEELNRLVV
jgi:hypothetical protein